MQRVRAKPSKNEGSLELSRAEVVRHTERLLGYTHNNAKKSGNSKKCGVILVAKVWSLSSGFNLPFLL